MEHHSIISAALAHLLTTMMDVLAVAVAALVLKAASPTLPVLDALFRPTWPVSNARAVAIRCVQIELSSLHLFRVRENCVLSRI